MTPELSQDAHAAAVRIADRLRDVSPAQAAHTTGVYTASHGGGSLVAHVTAPGDDVATVVPVPVPHASRRDWRTLVAELAGSGPFTTVHVLAGTRDDPQVSVYAPGPATRDMFVPWQPQVVPAATRTFGTRPRRPHIEPRCGRARIRPPEYRSTATLRTFVAEQPLPSLAPLPSRPVNEATPTPQRTVRRRRGGR